MSTGLIAGGSLAGIGLVALVAMEKVARAIDCSTSTPDGLVTHPVPAVLAFGALMAILAWAALRGPRPLADSGDAARQTANREH